MRQLVFDALTGRRIKPYDAAGGDAAGPDLAGLVDGGAVRIGEGRQLVLGDPLGLGVEQRNLVAAIFGDQQPVLVVDHHAPRPRIRGRERIPRDLAGLGVDLADMATLELGHPQIVLRIGQHLIDRGRPLGEVVERLEPLPFLGREVEPIYVLRADALRPHFAVDIVAQTDKVQLDAIIIVFGRQRIPFDLLGLGVEISERALVHGVEPERALLVELEREVADRRLLLELGHRVFGQLERLRVELRDERFAEIRIPDVALRIDEDVVRLGRPPRQVVFRDDGAGRAAGRPGEGLEGILPFFDLAQIDAGEVFGRLAVLLGGAGARRVKHALRLDRLAYRAVAAHARDHLGKFICIVRGAHDALERVAAHAVEQEVLLIIRAWQARHPFGGAHLSGEVLRLLQLEIDRGGLRIGDIRRRRGGNVVADGAYRDFVFA